jgi:8-oxo-dGTP diphosphatase
VPDAKIVVAAAVVERDGRYLVTRRLRGTHLEGLWEFPGGKCEPDETLTACLVRELREELDIDADVGAELFATSHDYPDRRVTLHFFSAAFDGQARPQHGQEMRWVARDELSTLTFPPADHELLLQLGGPSGSVG